MKDQPITVDKTISGQGGDTLQAEGIAEACGARCAFGDHSYSDMANVPSVRNDTAGGKSEKV